MLTWGLVLSTESLVSSDTSALSHTGMWCKDWGCTRGFPEYDQPLAVVGQD